ncbi:MAG: S8 family serine peptidase, partial [Clostridia bacterium]|nr:S8 family serine peptidase [Clostridia bacterium]
AIAVENPVYVYDTGIFNSSDVPYTGRGTIVAVLDTGCDYTHSAFTTHQVQNPLYDRDDIAALLTQTEAYNFNGHLEAREVYYGNITGNKIAFGYDYADRDPDIMPFSNEHGTHVAGIIAGKDDTITGVAVDAQLAIMKVFSDYEVGAEDGDILAALEDCVILGVDAINMSLGTSCGFSREVDDEYKNSIYDNIEAAGISLIVAASNDYSSGMGGEESSTNKTSNPDSATVGAPSTYAAALSVASISGRKDKYMLANGDREVFFDESYNMAAEEYDFFAMLGVTENNPLEYEYVTIPGIGLPINYAGLDMTGKIALVRRGEITFEEKVQYAAEAGAAAVIIYNNVVGKIIMTVGNHVKIPVISIGKDDGEALAAKETGVINFNFSNKAGPFMSDFSSWGPTPDLKLKPEITAHGGNILSAVPGGGYEEQSGTSMASPNMCGIAVLIRQYVKEKYPELSATEVRDMVNQLCMSTATIALDNKGIPYSPRKQGAGIADLTKATTTNAYLFVEGLGKTKLELGDDPTRSGVYTMSIQLKNLSDAAISYRIGSIAMTETVSSSDPEYVAERGYLLSNSAEYSVKDGTLTDGVVTVPAGGCATVTATLKLSAKDKSYLNASFKNGMFIEGFLTFDNTNENGVDLNAPFLAFYGDWSEAPIFDLDYYEVETEAHNNAIDDDDKIKADYYATTPMGSYYYDYIIPLGTYVYTMDEDDNVPIPATEEKAAVSYYKDCISGVYGVFAGLLRGAKEMEITIKNSATGEVVWSETQYNCYKSHYGGAPYPYFSEMKLNMVDTKTGEIFGYNNTRYEVTMSAKLDWEGNRNSNDTYSFSFYIDYEPPTIVDSSFRTEYDKSREENRYYVDLMVYDNQYAMCVFPCIVYETEDDDGDGEPEKTFSSLSDYPIPVYQENRGEVTKVSVEITDYLDQIRGTDLPEGICFYVTDYAMNGNLLYVPLPETENAELEFITSTLDMDINQTFDLTTYLAASDNRELEPVYLEHLTWTSSDETVVAVKNGKIEALKTGTATVSVTGSAWKEGDMPTYKSVVITVSENEADDPNSAAKVQIEELT